MHLTKTGEGESFTKTNRRTSQQEQIRTKELMNVMHGEDSRILF